MGTLSPDLISKDLDAVLNDAADMRKEFRHQAIIPELILLALIQRPNTAAARLFKVFGEQRGVDMERLERAVRIAVQSRRDQNGNLDFVARGNNKVPLSRQSIILLDDALSVAQAAHEVRIDTDHALTVLSESSMSTSGLLRQEGITPKAIQDIYTDRSSIRQTVKPNQTAMDMVQLGRRGDLHAVYFREELLRNIISVLSQAINRHVILVGPDGVGKRTLGYSLSLLMAEDKGPIGLSSFVQIDEVALLDNEQQAMRAGMNAARNGILFIPHLHRFFGGPIKAEFAKATSIVQKAFLDDDPVIIATTTELEYQQRLVNVSSLTENSQIIRVEEPSIEEAIEMMRINAPHMERTYDIQIEDEAVALAVNLAKRYLSATPLPRSAEHLLHRTAAMVSMSKANHPFRSDMGNDGLVDAEDVTLATSQMTGVPVSKLGEDERERYEKMDERLKERIKGQDDAVAKVSRAIKAARTGLKEANKPIGSFLFLGPTGVGKTELARVLADFMFGSENAMLALDMSEFKDESSINRLIGSPTGYVGSEEGGQLTEKVRQQPYIIVLFDEIEKAHPRVLDILLQVLEEGRLTDGRGVTTRFTEAVIIMTSNIGSDHLAVAYVDDEVEEQVMEEVLDHLRPEFINRIDEVVMFNSLTEEVLAQIMRLLLAKENELTKQRGLTLSFTEDAIDYLLSLNDEPGYGARPLKRIIRRNVREPLADFLLRANPPAGTEVHISEAPGEAHALKFAAMVDGEEVALES